MRPRPVSRIVRIATALKRDAPGHDIVRRICVRVGQRHTLTRSQTISAVTLLAVLPVKPLSRRRECAVRGGDLAGPEQAEHAGIVLGDHVDGAGVRLCRGAAVQGGTVAARNVDGVGVVDRREQPFVIGCENSLFEPLVLRGLEIGIDVVDAKRLLGERRRVGRIRLGRPRLFAWHVGLRYRTFFNRPYRLARHAIEDVEPARSCWQRRRHHGRARCAGSS